MTDMKNPAFAKATADKVKNEILGKRYKLSVVFISKKEIKALNKKYRRRNETTDVLSFALSERMGEIFICKEIAKKKSKDFDLKSDDYLLFLVIHGMLHLKGFLHGDKMEAYELAYHSRYRRRYL